MKIESGNTTDNIDTPNNENKSPKPPKGPKQYSKWVYVILGLFVVFGIGYTYMSSQKTDKPLTNTSTVESTKKSEDQTKASTDSTTKESVKASTESSTKESESEVASTVDAKPIITDFFKAYQEYSSKDKDTGARAKEMVKYATTDVVNQLLPGALDGNSQQQSMVAVYKFTEPVDIQPVVGEVNKYTAVLNYTVTVMGNESTHVDSYLIGMDNDKINSVIQKSYITK